MSSIAIAFLPFIKISKIFLQNPSLLNCIFHSVSSVLSRMFFNLNHAKNFTPGYIMVLHTVAGISNGILTSTAPPLSEGGYSNDDFWRHIKHFNYNYLRNAFHTALLNELNNRISPSLKNKSELLQPARTRLLLSIPNRIFVIQK